MKTIHERAVSNLNSYRHKWEDWRENHPKCPDFIAEKIIAGIRRSVMRRSVKDAVRHVSRDTGVRRDDYRGEMAATCAGLRRVTGLTGRVLRELGRQVRNGRFSWNVNWEIFSSVPDTAIGGMVGDIRRTGVYVGRGITRSAAWAEGFHSGHGVDVLIYMALTDAIRMDIGERDARNLMSRLAVDPAAKICGYTADTIMAYIQHGTATYQGYEGCSGGEQYTWFRAHPETWATLLDRAPVGQMTATAIQCYPHEHAKTAHAHEAGLFETFRMSDSIFSGSPQQVAAAIEKLNA